jgi:type IV secretion system protein VirB5
MIKRLSRSLTTTASTVALATALAGPVASQGVPTVDTQNIAQEIRQLQQMLQDFGIQTDLFDNALAQLDLLQQQFDQLEEMYASLTGPRSILGLAMGGDLDNLLQANFEDQGHPGRRLVEPDRPQCGSDAHADGTGPRQCGL